MDPTNKISYSVWPHFHAMNFYKPVVLRSQPSGNLNESTAISKEDSLAKSYPSAREAYQNSLARSNELQSSNTFTNNSFPVDVSRSTISTSVACNNINKNDEYFFGNLLYWSALVTGSDKLDLRIEMLRLVKSFTFESADDESIVQDETDKEFYNTLIPYTSRIMNKRKMELQATIINLLKKFAFYETDPDTGKHILFFFFF